MNDREITAKMLAKIREGRFARENKIMESLSMEKEENDNFVSTARILMEEAVEKKNDSASEEDKFPILKTTPQFGDVRTSQEETLRKTVGECIELEDDALMFYPQTRRHDIGGQDSIT